MNSGMEEFSNFLVDEMRFSPGTVDQTIRKMEYVLAHTSSDDRPALQEFIRAIWQQGNNKKANEYIKIINRFLKFKRLPGLKYFKEYESFTIKICTQEEKEGLLQAAERTGPREAAMFYLLFGTGIRLSEAVNLRIADIFPDRIFIIGKGQKKREVYLPPEAHSRIQKYLEVRTPANTRGENDFLFTTKKGNRMSYNFFRKICSRVAMGVGIKFHPHMARHFYATELLRQGISVFYVARLLGHEDLSSTQIYLHPSQQDAIESVRHINLFKGMGFNSKGIRTVWTDGDLNPGPLPCQGSDLPLIYRP